MFKHSGVRVAATIALILTLPSVIIAERKSDSGIQTVGCWQLTISLPQPMSTPFELLGQELIIHNDRAYLFGGQTSDDSRLVSVYYGDIGLDGALENWATTTPLPGRYYDHDVVRVGDYVYLLTGAAGDTAVYYAALEADGSLGTWHVTTSLAPSRQNFAATAYGTYVYVSGGNSGGTRRFVEFASVQPDGSLSAWSDTTSLPEDLEGHSMVAHEDYLYVVAADGSTYSAPIGSDGALGSWGSTTPLPTVASTCTIFEYGGDIFVVGGNSRSVHYAPIVGGGSLGAWKEGSELPEKRLGAWAGAHNGFAYVLGGQYGIVHRDTGYYIGVEALKTCTDEVPPENAIHPKVLLMSYNPYLPSVGKTVFEHENPNYVPPMINSRQLAHDFYTASGGYVDFEIVDEWAFPEFPPMTDGGRLSEEEYLLLRSQGLSYPQVHDGVYVDLERIMREHGVDALVRNYVVDEVWMYISWTYGCYETNMGGPGAFWINGPTFGADSGRAFAVVGLEAARGGGMHSVGHRAESTIFRAYGGGLDTPWARFRKNPGLGPDYLPGEPMGVGDVHHPPNAADDYHYAVFEYAETSAPDWLNFPNMTGETEIVNCETWGCYEDGYLLWWYSHFPSVSGVHPRADSRPQEMRQSNWWKYVFNFTKYAELVGEENVDPCNLEGCSLADFAASPTSGGAPLTVEFTNTSTGNYDTCAWDFGDGATSAAESPNHTYYTAGDYTVSLTVSGPGGSHTETKTDYIHVSELPQVVEFVPRESEAAYGKNTEVELAITADNFKAGQIRFTYDSGCANVTGWTRNTSDFPMGTWDSGTSGQEWITFSADESLTGIYTIGTLTIRCENQDDCTTPLDFVVDGAGASKLVDDWGNEIPATWQDGMFECISCLCGDVAPYPDCDSQIDMGDVSLLHSYVGHPGQYSLCCESAGDVAPYPSCDGLIDMGDVALLHSYVGHPGQYNLCCQAGASSASARAAPAVAAGEVSFLPRHSNAPIGGTTQVDIQVNAHNLKSGQVKFTYDATCADVMGWDRNTSDFTMGTWESGTSGEEWITFSAEDAVTGTYSIGTLTIGTVSQEFCNTTFDFVEDGSMTSKLFDDWGSEISATWADGTFRGGYGVYLPLVIQRGS